MEQSRGKGAMLVEAIKQIEGFIAPSKGRRRRSRRWADVDGKFYPAVRCPRPDVAIHFNKPGNTKQIIQPRSQVRRSGALRLHKALTGFESRKKPPNK